MLKRIQTYIADHNLLTKEGKHLVALSGGADSVVLLLILKQLGYNIEAIHCNFHLRGEESDRDEMFCVDLCKKHGINLHITHFDTKEYCRLNHVSIEMGARTLRYAYFHQLLHDIQAESICVAHHRNDCAETLLMNIIRGTGVTGLTAIRPKNGKIIRPLLCVSRDEIIKYLEDMQQDYVTDSSNLVNDVLRNKIRLDIMPKLAEINPSVTEALANTAEHIQQVMPLIEDSVVRCLDEIYVNTETYKQNSEAEAIYLKKLQQSAAPQYILYAFLSKYGIPAAMINQISKNIEAQTGKTWETKDYVIAIDRGKLIIEKQEKDYRECIMPMEGTYLLSNGHKIAISKENMTADFQMDKSADTALLDAETIMFPLVIRRVEQNDSFIPLGMKGRKLVSDFLTDRKLSIIQKRKQLCVTDASGKIVWIAGQRINNTNRITEKTINIVRLRYT